MTILFLLVFVMTVGTVQQIPPHIRQIVEQLDKLEVSSAHVRAGAAEALGFLRDGLAVEALCAALEDPSSLVRREAAMALAWCGGREAVEPLLRSLDDEDWVTRQAAWVSLTNLSGMEFPFDALASADVRTEQEKVWSDWWNTVPADQPPEEVVALLQDADLVENLAYGCSVEASSTYKGPPEVLTDGALMPDYWQTKNVPFPQHCIVDLGEVRQVGCVIVHQYGAGFCMTRGDVSVSLDGEDYEQVYRLRGKPSVELVINFESRPVRYVRITSRASENKRYPTTFREIEVRAAPPPDAFEMLLAERGLRALGALGGQGASEVVLKILRPYALRETPYPAEKTLVQAGLRSLGRLRSPKALPLLVSYLDNPHWARYAADALADFGGDQAESALLSAYSRYGRTLDGNPPVLYPPDDWPNLSPSDRMFETPYAIASALARLPLENEQNLTALRKIAPLLVANMPSDYDAAMLYETEAYQLLTAYLLDKVALRRSAVDAAFRVLGADAKPHQTVTYSTEENLINTLAERLSKDGEYAVEKPYMEVASWLPTFCRDTADVPTLIDFLEHDSGWVRINAAKALMFMDARQSVEPLSRLLAESAPEGSYGYFGKHINYETVQGQDEYDDPVPRWREAFIRALSRLGATSCVPLFEEILQDDRNTVGIQYAAALALDELGTSDALEALSKIMQSHPFHSIRLVAREALWRRGVESTENPHENTLPKPTVQNMGCNITSFADAGIVFIQGPNKMPNQFQIDPWRQTYSTTDTGPTYRLGNNLFVLQPATAAGAVKQITHFEDGYVADCEVSWDGQRVIFARRGGDADPWWHVWEVNVDGTGLRQITDGPYHDVQPVYLGDGRIVFSSSRIGLRDEYHGYLACGLSVMNSDGSDIQCIGFNLGGDREPSIMEDGRILFSRLELFYSRLKTELVVEAVYPDGTKNVTLYGPERREFWRQATQNAGERWWGEAPPRHRVLRMTQPQPFGDGRILCASTAGLTLVGPGRWEETVIPHDKNMAVTSPFPLGDGQILCAATVKDFEKTGEANAKNIDLALYTMDAETGVMELLYNNPETSEFEARPLRPQLPPPLRAEASQNTSYTGSLFCNSARISQEERVRERGKLVRVIEGQPIVTRHRTHRSRGGPAWKNHTGTHARVLGTVPLAADGSFSLEVPADRLIHLQVLDSDRRVVGNQQIWMYVRPGETRSCVGCHENPDIAPPPRNSGFPDSAEVSPVACLPTGGEFSYRAKFWNKGTLTDEGEERTRTTRAVNLLGR